MSRITCRNGFVFVASICLGLMVTSAHGGSLDAPAGPTDPASAMWTLKDIYDVLDTRTTNVTKRTSFKEPTAGPTNVTMHNLDAIMTMVTNRAPVPKSGQTNTYATRDDGALKIGVAWPTPRFTVVGALGTAETNQIRDNLTGLIWARDANIFGQTNWGAAVTNCNNLTYGGTNDWRLPNRPEVESLINLSRSDPDSWLNTQGFAGVQSGYYWSSTTVAGTMANAWNVHLSYSIVNGANKTGATYVWPIRGGQ